MREHGPRVYVGTSGWMYDWNREGTLDWYIAHSGLNAVELNASFYRFPFPRQIESWAKKGSRLRWAVKVHRSITHIRRLNEKALAIFNKFYKLFRPMDHLVDFYLFQLPPSYAKTTRNMKRLERLAEETGLGERLAIEFRHPSWFNNETVEFLRELGATIVSIDSPQATWIALSGSKAYLRLHGRTGWYFHDYARQELEELANRLLSLQPESIYAFFNNNHWMLENARLFKKLLEEKLSSHHY